jgi:hypothetical protein
MWWCGKRIAAKLIRNPVIREAAGSKRETVTCAKQWPDSAAPAQGRTAHRRGGETSHAAIRPHTALRGYLSYTANSIPSVISFYYRKAWLGWAGTPVRRLIEIKS